MNKLIPILLLILLGAATSAWATPVPVTWTAPVGISVNGNSHTKTAAQGWGNAGAYSVEGIPADGYVECSVDTIVDSRMCGASTINTDADFRTLHFAVWMVNGSMFVFESATNRGAFGTLAINDVVRISRSGTTITYLVNGLLRYTSTVSSTGTLHADTALENPGGTISNAMIEFADLIAPTWAAPAGVVTVTNPSQNTLDVNLASGARADNIAVDRVRVYYVAGSGPVDRGSASFQDFTTTPTTVATVTLTGLASSQQYAVEATIQDAAGNEESLNSNGEILGTTTAPETVPPFWTAVSGRSDIAVTQDAAGVVTATWTGADDLLSNPVSYSVCWTRDPGDPDFSNGQPTCTALTPESSVCSANVCTMVLLNAHPYTNRFAVAAKDSNGNGTPFNNIDTVTAVIAPLAGTSPLTLEGGAAFGAAPLVGAGGAVTLDGVNDTIAFAADAKYNRVQDFTVIGWFKFTGVLDSQLFWFPFGKYNGSIGPSVLLNGSWGASGCAGSNVNTIFAYVFGGDGGVCNGPATQLVAGTTYMITLTDTAGSLMVCLDGSCGTPTATVIPATVGPWRINNRGDGASTFAAGSVDAVEYYSRGLTAAEVATIHTAATSCTPNSSDCWNLDETTGTVATGTATVTARGIVENGSAGETLTGTWATVTNANYSGGDALQTTAAGASYTRTVQACHLFAVTEQRQTGMGTIQVKIDDRTLPDLIDLNQPYMNAVPINYTVPLLLWSDPECGYHTVTLTTQDTGTVTLDAIAAVMQGHPASALTNTLTCLGDSVTVGVKLANVNDRFCTLLAADLGYTESNRGFSGRGLGQALANAYDGLEADLPRTVTVVLPLNNTRHGGALYETDMRLRIRSLLTWITAVYPGTDLRVGNNTPMTNASWNSGDEWGAGSDSLAFRVDGWIEEALWAFPHARYADLHRSFAGNAVHLDVDGIHPIASGHQILFQQLKHAKPLQTRFK